jgi:hypothetical protein
MDCKMTAVMIGSVQWDFCTQRFPQEELMDCKMTAVMKIYCLECVNVVRLEVSSKYEGGCRSPAQKNCQVENQGTIHRSSPDHHTDT